MTGTLSSILSILMAVIQLAFPLMGTHSYEGTSNITLDNTSYTYNMSADTASGTISATLSALDIPVFSIEADRNSASISGLMGNGSVQASQNPQLLVWKNIAEYLFSDNFSSDLELLGNWLATFTPPAPIIVYENDTLCLRYTFQPESIEGILRTFLIDLNKPSAESAKLQQMKLWKALNLDAEIALQDCRSAISMWLYRQNLYSIESYWENQLYIQNVTLTLVTNIKKGEPFRQSVSIQSGHLCLVSGKDDWQSILEADITANAISGTIQYANNTPGSFFICSVGDSFIANVDARWPYRYERMSANYFKNEDEARLTISGSYSGKTIEVVLDNQQLRFYTDEFEGYMTFGKGWHLQLSTTNSRYFYALRKANVPSLSIDIVLNVNGISATWDMNQFDKDANLVQSTGTLGYSFTSEDSHIIKDKLTVIWTVADVLHNLSVQSTHHFK